MCVRVCVSECECVCVCVCVCVCRLGLTGQEGVEVCVRIKSHGRERTD